MSKEGYQKIKLLKIWEILQNESDEENPISTVELLKRLEERGIKAERKAIYRDIEELNAYGYEVMSIKGRSNKYYIADRKFSTPELKILIDSVQAANFVTVKKTSELNNKLAALAGSNRAELLKRDVIFCNSIKQDNEKIYYNTDIIDKAIILNKKISYFYFDYDFDRKKVYRKEKTRYIANPVALTISDGFYYLVTYNDEHQGFANYRVDRMERIEIEENDNRSEICLQNEEKWFDYIKQQFSMYIGDVTEVTIICKNEAMSEVFDRFGRAIKRTWNDKDNFQAKVTVQVSRMFYSWCSGFSGDIKITAPQEVVKGYREWLENLLKNTVEE